MAIKTENKTAGVEFREFYVTGTPKDNYSGSTTVFDLVGSHQNDGLNLRVYVNGVLNQPGGSNDYLETDADTVTFNSALTVGDEVQFIWSRPTTDSIIIPTGAVERRETFTAAGGSEQFTLSTGAYKVDAKNIRVTVNGSTQSPGTNYTEDNGTQFTISSGLSPGDTVEARWIERIGNLVNSTPAVENRENFTAAGGAEVFPLTGTYTPNGINAKVTVDGALVTVGDDYTETGGGTSITFGIGQELTVGQKVSVFWVEEQGRQHTAIDLRSDQTASASQTAFSAGFSFQQNGKNLRVYDDGILMRPGAANDYVETSSSTILFNVGRTGGAVITLIAQGSTQIGNATTLGGFTADDFIQISMLF